MNSMKAGKGEEDIRKANEDLGLLKDGGERESRESHRDLCLSPWRGWQNAEGCVGGSFSSLRNSVR